MPMDFTGERYVPELRGQIYYEHLHRYMLAFGMARDLDVLDIASGEGYGAAYLAIAARSVVGVDIDPQSVRHAAARYTAMNLSFRAGSCTQIPLADKSVDLVVSFETIEHIEEHERFLAEIARVLRPDGRLVISSPNKVVYSDRDRYANPYHVRELYFDELRDLLCGWFAQVRLYGQRIIAASAVHPLRGLAPDARCISPTVRESEHGLPALPEPAYFIAVCARSAGADLAALDSMFIDPRDDLLADIVRAQGPFREQLPAHPGAGGSSSANGPAALTAAAAEGEPLAAVPTPREEEIAAELERRDADRETLKGLVRAVLGGEEAGDALTDAAGRAHDRLHSLFVALEHLQQRVAELEDRAAADAQRQDAQAARLAELEDAHAAAQARADGAAADAAAAAARAADLEARLEAAEGARLTAEMQREAADVQRETAAARLETAEAQRDEAQAQRDEAQALRAAAEAARDAAEADRAAADALRQAAEAQRDAAAGERDAAAAEAEAARAEAAQADERVRALDAEHAAELAAHAREAEAQQKALQSRVDAFATALEEGMERLAADAARTTELASALAGARAELQAARAEAESTAAELARTRALLVDVVESTSWRMTKPLRVAMRAMRRG
jgi:SAM-dependent methyltransferase